MAASGVLGSQTVKPFIHAKTSARKYGGKPEDYYAIHTFIDGSKAAVADMRHRAALHNAFGCFVIEAVFGITAVNSEGKTYSPRDVAEDHIIEDLGFIPTLEMWLKNMALQPWMGGNRRAEHVRADKTRAGKTDPTETAINEQMRALGIDAIGHKKVD